MTTSLITLARQLSHIFQIRGVIFCNQGILILLVEQPQFFRFCSIASVSQVFSRKLCNIFRTTFKVQTLPALIFSEKTIFLEDPIYLIFRQFFSMVLKLQSWNYSTNRNNMQGNSFVSLCGSRHGSEVQRNSL